MGFLRPVSHADESRRAPTNLSAAQTLQRAALVCPGGLSVAHMLPNDLPSWSAVRQQTQRWLRAGCLAMIAEDLRTLLRVLAERSDVPGAMIVASRTLQSTPESGGRAGYDGAKKRKGSKVHVPVATLGHLLALKVTAAHHQDRAQVGELPQAVQQVTGQHVELAYVDQGYTGPTAAAAAQEHEIKLEMVKLNQAKKGFVLLPKRWLVITGSPSRCSCSNRSSQKVHDRL